MFEFFALITRWEKRERGAKKWHSYATAFLWIAAPRSKFKNRVSFRRFDFSSKAAAEEEEIITAA